MIVKSEQKRSQILKAASELFSEFGYQVNMDQIAKHANVSKQTVYSHFQNKEILFETCILTRCKEREIGSGAFDNNAPVEHALLEFGIRFQNMHLEDMVQQTFRNAVSQAPSHPEIGALYLRSGPIRTVAMLSAYLDSKHQSGELKLSTSSDTASMQLLLMFHGKAAYWAFFGGDSNETEEDRTLYIKQCVTLFLNSNT